MSPIERMRARIAAKPTREERLARQAEKRAADHERALKKLKHSKQVQAEQAERQARARDEFAEAARLRRETKLREAAEHQARELERIERAQAAARAAEIKRRANDPMARILRNRMMNLLRKNPNV